MAARPATRRAADRRSPGAARACATSRRSGSARPSSGTSARPTTSCSACPTTPARPTTCPPPTGRGSPRRAERLRGATSATRLDLYGNEMCMVLARPRGGPSRGDRRRDRSSRLLEAADDETILRTIIGDDLRDPDGPRDRASGRSPATRRPSRRWRARRPATTTRTFEAWLARSTASPATVIEPAVEVLAAWLPTRSSAIEPRVAAMIAARLRGPGRRPGHARRRRAHRADDRRHPLAVGAGRPAGHPRAVVLRRPYNFLLGGADWRLFGYPIADDALDGDRPARAAARGRPPPPGARRRDAAADPAAAARPRPVPDRDRPAARPVQADHQAPPGAAARRRPRDDHRGRRRHLLQPPAATGSTTRRASSSASCWADAGEASHAPTADDTAVRQATS